MRSGGLSPPEKKPVCVAQGIEDSSKHRPQRRVDWSATQTCSFGSVDPESDNHVDRPRY